MKRFLSFITLCVLLTGQVLADTRLPNQPKDPNGGYIVLWDCTAKNGLGDFAASNDMQWDETFVFAINLAGTELGDWVMQNPQDTRRVRSVAFDKMTTNNDHWQDNTARLWHIRDTIFGATFNFKQMPGSPITTQANGNRLAIRAQIFGFETVLGDKCGTAPTIGSLWYQRASFYSAKDSEGYLFRFAAFTGNHNEAAFTSNTADDSRNRWVDNGNRITPNGYASPWSNVSPCPRFYTTDYALTSTTTTVCPLDAASQSATISTTGSMNGYTYMLYRDDVPVANGSKSGNNGNLSWTTNQPGTYTVWYYKTSENNTPVLMVPCSGASEITLSTGASCCQIDGVAVSVSNDNPGPNETITLTASWTSEDDQVKTIEWWCNGTQMSGWTETGNGKTQSVISVKAGDATTNNGYYTYHCKVRNGTCYGEAQKQIHVTPQEICPAYTWAIDGAEGAATPMYSGGWYDISCTCEAGAPTVAITGTGVTTVNTTTNGNTTTVRIELSGTATGEMQFAASNAANSALNYKACGDTLHPIIAECDGMTADTWKIEWSNFDGFPQFTYLNFARVFLRDNNGHLEADTAHTDGMDEWNIIYAGEKFNNTDSIFYIQNALTRRYLYRGSQHGNVGSDWEYAEALLGASNAQTDDYKWIFVKFQEAGKTRTAIVCKNGYTGTTANLYNGAYVIHNRNWEAVSLFGNAPQVARPGLPCGKMANQQSSPAFRLKGMEHPATSAFGAQTTLSWNGTAPTDTVHLLPEGTCTYTAQRTDDIHSINRAIHYEVADATVATVDAQTGAVTALVEDGTTEVMAILESVGCFTGDTLRYVVTIYECGEQPVISSPLDNCDKNQEVQITVTHPAGTNESAAWVFTHNDGNNASVSTDGKFKANNYGTYTFYYQVTNTAHPDCNRQSEPITIIAKEKEDYSLPRQPKAQDGTYVVLWNCDANDGQGDWAEANTMEWGETFTLAINLAGTPLGNWVMKPSSTPGAVRTVAFDRFLKKYGDDQTEHMSEDACRLWHIRDTIFGATFNFKQIPLKNGQTHTPATGATTGIAARIFGVEAAHGDKCGNTKSVSKWWVWSDANSVYSEFGGQWLQGKYVSEDDEYLFHFAPYTGKSDAAFTAQDDDVRDRWYDSGHDFSTPGNKAPCTLDWPADQTLSIDKQTICVDNQETATLTMGGSEAGWEYSLYNNNALVSSSTQAGTGAALTWTISAAGSYTVQATSTNGQHDDQMGSCTNNGVIAVSNGGCQTPVCPDPVNIPYPNLTYNLNADAFPIELAEASGNNVRYQWFCYTDANPTPQPYTGEGATTNACIPATNTEGKVYYYCMVYTDDCPDGVVYCNTADVTVEACQTLNGTTFTLTSTKTNYDEGEQIVLTANFNGWGGEHTYVWTLNGTPIDSTATHQIVQDFQTSTLTIPAAAASDGGTYTVTIYDGPDCHKDASRTITVKEQEPIEPDERKTELTVCAGEPITLTADSTGHNYEWNTTETTRSITVTPTQIGGTETYTVRVWDYKIKSSNNLMANGDFENYTDYHQPPTGFTSDYNHQPYDPQNKDHDMYNKPEYSGKSGIYMLACNANDTWKGFAAVTPHGGKYFALFDAAHTGFAWRVTTNDNPNMKLQKGAKYIFSYWAADLNTGSERNHPAELQFSINYKDATGQMQKEYLGQKMTLGKDNKWHYSETFWIAPCNSDYIEIGVEDQCDYAGPGNDFGLDDIIFQMVTGEMEYTVDKQKWVLTVEDCTPEECIENRIYRKWNDLLFVDNADHRYTAYQWYCDGKAIDGATGQYYYEEGKILAGDGHRYHCVVTLAAGGTETLCDMLFNEFPTSLSQGRHPAPAKVRVYSPAGKLLMTGTSDQDIIPTLNPGCYLIYSEDEDGETTTTKLLIY